MVKFGKEQFNFVPNTYLLPQDKNNLVKDIQKGEGKKWFIVKPSNSSQGRGIYLINKFVDLKLSSNILVSE
jgi:tubulin polyglutamylase TTLL4